jgi:hypothetical protein|tara:strand:- start:768 stop:1133 length:366 start_codon:yes stop_codon:yes gene_type:complete
MYNISALLAALIAVESGGDPNAIGDDGEAVGVLQMHRGVIDDVNRIFGTDFIYDDRYEEQMSRTIAILYLSYWGGRFEDNTGMKVTAETYARIWNGGPNGWNKKSTDAYWQKVKEILEWQQ